MSGAAAIAAPASRRGGGSGGLAWRGVAEGAALVGLMLALDLALGDGGRFAALSPHPFGLAVLLVAAQYGVAEAAAVALVSTVALHAGNLPPQAFGQSQAAWLAGLALQPLLWFGAALLVGGIGARARARAATAEAQAAATRRDLEVAVASGGRMAGALAALEAKVAGQTLTATALYEAARDLGPDRAAVLRAAPGLVRAATGCARCSLFLLEGDVLRLAAESGWEEGDPWARAFEPGSALHAAVVVDRATLVASRAADRAGLGREGLLAAPVTSSDGVLFGLLKVEELGFARLHLDTVANFQAAAGWLGAALAAAADYERARDDRLLAEGGQLVSARHADRIAGYVTAVARRTGFDLTLLSVEVADGAPGPLEAARRAMEEIFRDSDMLLETHADRRRMSVLLAGTDLSGAQIAAARLRTAAARLDPAAATTVSVTCAVLNGARP